MPVFNAALYLDEAIKSILVQSLTEFELIIINDGSTDNSYELLKQWEKKDNRIRVYNQTNMGRSKTRNRGIELSSTDYIAMMDADDISMPNRLKICYEYLENNLNVVAVSGQYEHICMYGVPLYIAQVPFDHQSIEKSLLQDHGNNFTQGASLIRKSVVENAGGYNPSYEMGEDADLFLRMALIGELVNLPEIFLQYRRHPSSITNIADKKLLKNCIERLRKAWEDRGLTLDSDFEHWLEVVPERRVSQDILKWGWNALSKGEVTIARKYAKALVLSEPFNSSSYRFLYCAVRGR